MKRRLCSMLLILALLAGMLTVPAAAATVTQSGTCGSNLTWVLTDDGTLTISGTGSMKEYYLVSTAPWYEWKDSITKVVIEEGVTTVGTWAFYSCHNLASVSLPSTLQNIGYYAFSYCYALPEITLPESCTKIGSRAFLMCTALQSITLPAGLTYIGEEAFISCTAMGQITFTGSAPTIEDGAFSNVSAMVYYPAGDESWTEEVRTSYGGALSWVASDADNTVAETLASGSFGTALTWTLTTLGDLTISGSGAMPDWNASRSTCYYTVAEASGGTREFFFRGAMSASNEAYSMAPWAEWNTIIRSVVIETGVTSVGSLAFADCTALTSVTLPAGLTSIGILAFYNCDALQAVTLPAGLTTIGNYAFLECDLLTSITVPTSVSSIGREALGFSGSPFSGTARTDFAITGYTGTAASSYASQNGLSFVSLGTVYSGSSSGSSSGGSGSSTASSSGSSSSGSTASRYTDITSGSYYDS